jgi:hypothetical protein
MADGGQVYTGPTASRALRAIGARAMTLDKDIFVAEDFDDSSAEDQALYAHERHHQMEHGRVDAGAHAYAEEKAAQTIERMVLHRSKKGEAFGSIMRDVNSGAIHRDSQASSTSGGGSSSASQPGETKSDAEKAILSLMKSGKSREQIVRKMAEHILDSLQRANEINGING